MDLPIKDLQALRQQYVEQRNDVKQAAELEDRDLNEADVAEMERLATEIRKVDLQLKVKREDQSIAKSAVLAGEASNGEARELQRMNKRFNLSAAVREAYQHGRVTGVAAEFTEQARNEAKASGVSLRGTLSIPDAAIRAAVDGTAGDFSSGSTTPASAQGFQVVGKDILTGIEALASQTVFQRAGGRVLNGLQFNTDIPTVATASTISEVDEGAAPGADSNMALGRAQLTPQRFSAFATVSQQLMTQSGNAIEQLIVNDMRVQMDRQIDKHVFGVIQPDNTDGDYTAVSAANIAAAEGALIANGVNFNNIVAIANGDAHTIIAQAVVAAGVTPALDRSNNTLLGHPYFVTDLITEGVGATGELLMGDMNMAAALGFFGGLDIILNPYSFDTAHDVRISCHRYAGAATIHAGAVLSFHDDAA
jgi:HK97 family phage major capsid protein